MGFKMRLLAVIPFILISAVLSCNGPMKSYIEQLQRDHPQKCMKCPPITMNNNCMYNGKKMPCYNGTATYNLLRVKKLCGTVALRCHPAVNRVRHNPAQLVAAASDFTGIPCNQPIPKVNINHQRQRDYPRTTPAPCVNHLNKIDFGLQGENSENIIGPDGEGGRPYTTPPPSRKISIPGLDTGNTWSPKVWPTAPPPTSKVSITGLNTDHPFNPHTWPTAPPPTSKVSITGLNTDHPFNPHTWPTAPPPTSKVSITGLNTDHTFNPHTWPTAPPPTRKVSIKGLDESNPYNPNPWVYESTTSLPYTGPPTPAVDPTSGPNPYNPNPYPNQQIWDPYGGEPPRIVDPPSLPGAGNERLPWTDYKNTVEPPEEPPTWAPTPAVDPWGNNPYYPNPYSTNWGGTWGNNQFVLNEKDYPDHVIPLSRPGHPAYIHLTCNDNGQWEVENNDGNKIVGIENVYCIEHQQPGNHEYPPYPPY